MSLFFSDAREHALKVIRSALQTGDLSLPRKALAALGHSRSMRHRAPFETRLQSPNPELAATSARVLGSIGAVESPQSCSRCYQREMIQHSSWHSPRRWPVFIIRKESAASLICLLASLVVQRYESALRHSGRSVGFCSGGVVGGNFASAGFGRVDSLAAPSSPKRCYQRPGIADEDRYRSLLIHQGLW